MSSWSVFNTLLTIAIVPSKSFHKMCIPKSSMNQLINKIKNIVL